MTNAPITISKAERKHVKGLVAHYVQNQGLIEVILTQLTNAILGSPRLMTHVHSTKRRMKDPDHLEDKLLRKLIEAKKKKKPFTISEKNLLYRINDLAGFRILHLYTEQI